MVMQDAFGPPGGWSDDCFVANHPALDFVNTVSDRVNTRAGLDRLARFGDVVTWAEAAGLIDPGALNWRRADLADAGAAAARARALREAAHGAFAAIAAGAAPPAGALGPIAETAARGFAAGALAPARAGRARLVAPDADGLVGLIAWAMLDALIALPADRIGRCTGCGWLFVDTTRGGRRRWCVMRACGNREKARRFRARRDAGAEAPATE